MHALFRAYHDPRESRPHRQHLLLAGKNAFRRCAYAASEWGLNGQLFAAENCSTVSVSRSFAPVHTPNPPHVGKTPADAPSLKTSPRRCNAGTQAPQSFCSEVFSVQLSTVEVGGGCPCRERSREGNPRSKLASGLLNLKALRKTVTVDR